MLCTTDLKNIVTQSVEQVVRHHADRVHARARPELNPRAAELDGRVVDRIENGHVELARVQERLQDLQHKKQRDHCLRYYSTTKRQYSRATMIRGRTGGKNPPSPVTPCDPCLSSVGVRHKLPCHFSRAVFLLFILLCTIQPCLVVELFLTSPWSLASTSTYSHWSPKELIQAA